MLKKLLLLHAVLFSAFPALAGDAVIFNGNFVKALKDQLLLYDTARIITGTADPTAVATIGEKGSLYLRQTAAGNGAVYIKTDTGSSTNWRLIQTSPGPALTASRAVVTDASGFLSSSPTTATQIALLQSAAGTTGTASTNLVFSTSPTLVTPAIGAATGSSLSVSGQLTSTVASGTAPLVVSSTTLVPNLYVARAVLADSATTNANLTGPITSVGNATSIASQTGTGTKFVVDNGPTLIAPVIGAATGTSLSVSGQLTSTVATGTAPLVVSSATLVPNLYVARSVLADSATTNANLTGPITSVGNATSIASQTGTGTKFVVDTTPTLVTPVLGVATATSINKVAVTAPATSATLTLADGSTLATSGAFSTTLTATGATNVTLPTTGTLATNALVTSTTNGLAAASSTIGLIRYNTSAGYGAVNTKIRRIETLVINTSDITYASTSNNGTSFTIVTAGVYALSYGDTFTGLNTNMGISVNSAQLTTAINAITDANRVAMMGAPTAGVSGFCSYVGYFAAGDVIRPHTDGTTGSGATTLSYFSIQRVL